MSHFNLIEEAWIPVHLLDGSRTELGVRETLLRSREIMGIEDSSPLVVAAMHRFLVALLYRALDGPTDREQAKALFRQGLPEGKITAYLDRWHERFWLFHEKWPFGQISEFTPKEWRAWTALAAEYNADNAKVLFDHMDVQAPGMIQPAAAARWLLAAQTFSVSCGKSELSHTKTAPSATAVMILPLGQDLQDTLLFGLVPEGRHILKEDLPLWERDPESVKDLCKGPSRPVCGIADRYTWRTRSIRLLLEPAGGVSHLAFASGVDCGHGDDRDPMLGYRIDEKVGRFPIQFHERGLWRDFDSILPDESKLSPQVLEHAIDLTWKAPDRFPRTTLALGQANDKAKIEFWRMERFELPPALARGPGLRAEIHGLLDLSEQAEKPLWQACASFARDLISRGSRSPDRKDIRAFVDQMVPIPIYWSILETRFHQLLHSYTLERPESEIKLQWSEAVREALSQAWEKHRASVSMGDAWTMRALAKAEGPLRFMWSALNRDIAVLKSVPTQEEA